MNATPLRLVIAMDLRRASYRVVEAGQLLASRVGAHVHLVHVLEEPFMMPAPYQRHLPDTPSRRRQLREQRLAALEVFAEALRERGIGTSVEVRSGEASEQIVQAASDHAADVLVMGTQIKKGFDHLLRRGVTDRVLSRTPCPILIVPAGRIGTQAACVG